MVGRTPWSAADALVGLLALCTGFAQWDQGVPRGPGIGVKIRLGIEARFFTTPHGSQNAVSEELTPEEHFGGLAAAPV